jgi:hypothetical protein
MGSINWSRIVLGGLLAGLIINVFEMLVNGFWLEKDWAAVMASLGKTGQMGVEQILAFNLWGFVMGIVSVWLYAAIRPRYGAGPKTAAIAAGAVWIIGYFLSGVAPIITGLFPVRIMAIGMTVGLVEVMIGTHFGARIYREESTSSPLRAAAAAGD